ncbi:MAG: hypothetical protein WCQ47_01855 [bacterium]
MISKFLFLIMFLFPLSLYSQIRQLEAFTKIEPESKDRVNEAQAFLQNKIHIAEPIVEDKIHPNRVNILYSEDFKTRSGAKGTAYTYKNGRVLIILNSQGKEKEVSFSAGDLPEKLIEALISEQNKGRTLTDVVNIANNIGEDGRMLVAIHVQRNKEKKSSVDFHAPFVVLVTLSSALQLELEDLFFKTINLAVLNELFFQDDAYKNAYHTMMEKRDFKSMLLRYIKISDIYISNLSIVEKIMERLSTEFTTEPFNMSKESMDVLNNPFTLKFIENVSEKNKELVQFYYYVRFWNRVYAELFLEEFNEGPSLSNKMDNDFINKEIEFRGSFNGIITKYLSGRSTGIAK